MDSLIVRPIRGVPEVMPGDDVARLISEAIVAAGLELEDRDVVVVTHKIVSKAEGRIVDLDSDDPDAHRYLVDEEAAAIIRRRGSLVIARTRHGFVCANAGVDRSNAGPARAILLPLDPDLSANRIRLRLRQAHGVEVAVVISDTFGRPWRRGLTDVAIGVAGMAPVTDLRGTKDAHGKVLEVSEVAVADEIAAAADLVMGKASQIPAALVRGAVYEIGSEGATSMVRPSNEDMFL
ncbi:MAG: coenzyme F420-0:L-glutamate ligase [Acidimicrobiia bacterium]|nr:coenzyme F420-0:L-glutamate ligase [Acidimicrobiia bacterium]MDH4309295.1 coenzyme F420-0:L-glutamate ligase [Acidimicrobiia bacterium]MDH5292475.1 coenzyme F420-0:L-glutamate ligase [Acidimicrobiia bacterium]